MSRHPIIKYLEVSTLTAAVVGAMTCLLGFVSANELVLRHGTSPWALRSERGTLGLEIESGSAAQPWWSHKFGA